MEKPAARVTDLLSNAGMITGPGASNVLINGLPAARLGDNHSTPMVIPGSPPLPLVGGPLIGPGCPNVFINGMPAAVSGDMAVTAGPPGTVMLGSPNVLIGTSGLVMDGSSGQNSIFDAILKSLQNGTIKPLDGTESTSIEKQAQVINAARFFPSPAVQSALEESLKESDSQRLFISDFVGALKSVEKKNGTEVARFIACKLNYHALSAMAMLFTVGIDNDIRNDPSQMPSRFMLLYGADDEKLREIDNHPDSFDGHPEHKITVANLRKALKALGYDAMDCGPLDDLLYEAFVQYLTSY